MFTVERNHFRARARAARCGGDGDIAADQVPGTRRSDQAGGD
jgi:hypothetical protein